MMQKGLIGLASGRTASAHIVRDKRRRFIDFDLTLPRVSTANMAAKRDQLQQIGLAIKRAITFASKPYLHNLSSACYSTANEL